MANLKEIRDRIKSVKNTRKITEAMRLVAAAKVRQDLVGAAFADRPRAGKPANRIALESADTLLLQARDPRHITLVAMTDRGRGFNANIIKRTEQRFAELKASGYEVALITVGRKVDTYFQNRNYPITASFTGLDQLPTSTDALQVSDAVQAEFLGGATDRVELIYTKFINLVSTTPVSQTLLPLDPQGIASPDDEIFRFVTKDGELGVERSSASNQEDKRSRI